MDETFEQCSRRGKALHKNEADDDGKINDLKRALLGLFCADLCIVDFK